MTVQVSRYCQLLCLLFSLTLGVNRRAQAVTPIGAEASLASPSEAQTAPSPAIAPNNPNPRVPVPVATGPDTAAVEAIERPIIILSDAELDTANTDAPDTEALNTEVSDTEAPDIEAPDAEATDIEALDAEATDTIPPAITTEEATDENNFIDPELQQQGDPELGVLRLRERPLQKPSQPKFVFLTGSFSYFRSDNILSSEIDTIGDQLLGGRLILSARPIIGPRTLLVGTLEGNLIRYGDLSDLDYNGFGLKVGIRHFWSRQAFSEFSWDNRQLFLDNDGDRFLNDHSLRLSLFYRVPLVSRLKLDNYYQFRWSVTDPTDRSRIVNRLGTVLGYDLTPTMQIGLNYQYDLTHFTQRDREDSYHQVIAQFSWDLSRAIQFNLYGGYSFGASSASDVNFNGSILGAGMSFNLPLF